MTFDSNAPGNSVSFLLIFLALIGGLIMAPCEWCARKTGMLDENWLQEAKRKKHYPGCPDSYTDYMCTYHGHEWDGTYQDEYGRDGTFRRRDASSK